MNIHNGCYAQDRGCLPFRITWSHSCFVPFAFVLSLSLFQVCLVSLNYTLFISHMWILHLTCITKRQLTIFILLQKGNKYNLCRGEFEHVLIEYILLKKQGYNNNYTKYSSDRYRFQQKNEGSYSKPIFNVPWSS